MVGGGKMVLGLDGKQIVLGKGAGNGPSRSESPRTPGSAVSVPVNVDVKAIRSRLEMSQEEFAKCFAVPVSTLRNWEQGHRSPEGPARILLTLIERIPEEVRRALHSA